MHQGEELTKAQVALKRGVFEHRSGARIGSITIFRSASVVDLMAHKLV